eukprot:CAMPEP_0113936242 /NCGR_PEP_ID=MMETSP1339-20121228/3199_1 /TAXON_ID=94617 /ORGANISM="Fibrocapsa japonica" /LENGTH=105 /DNA_ID=CAMNT_0000938647 /DNA_START=115 /DNA_END=432 /DNA_ORIENTATION=+ /assembly_acc=CAM_ASM_000762
MSYANISDLNPAVLVAILVAMISPMILLMLNSKRKSSGRVNSAIKLDNPKVVDKVCCKEIEDIGKDGKVVMCRCWKSKKFPYCDGAHTAHNKETGDNVGPLIIEK